MLIVPALSFAEPAGADKAIGEVVFVKGKVTVASNAGAEKMAVLQMPVFRNDKIASGGESKIQIRFSDGSVIWLGENSEIVMDEYVYVPNDKNNVSFAMRMIRGACRIATGAITTLNPDRFKVRTRMATVGIRGCELGIGGGVGGNDVYVLKLGKGESVFIVTTSNGQPVMNVITGESLPIDEAVRKVVNIDRPGTIVSVTDGRGFSQRQLSPEEISRFGRMTTQEPTAQYDAIQSPDGSVFSVTPRSAGGRSQ